MSKSEDRDRGNWSFFGISYVKSRGCRTQEGSAGSLVDLNCLLW